MQMTSKPLCLSGQTAHCGVTFGEGGGGGGRLAMKEEKNMVQEVERVPVSDVGSTVAIEHG